MFKICQYRLNSLFYVFFEPKIFIKDDFKPSQIINILYYPPCYHPRIPTWRWRSPSYLLFYWAFWGLSGVIFGIPTRRDWLRASIYIYMRIYVHDLSTADQPMLFHGWLNKWKHLPHSFFSRRTVLVLIRRFKVPHNKHTVFIIRWGRP